MHHTPESDREKFTTAMIAAKEHLVEAALARHRLRRRLTSRPDLVGVWKHLDAVVADAAETCLGLEDAAA